MRRFNLDLLGLILILCISNAHAQEAAVNQIFEFSDFSKGLNTKLSPFDLLPNQGDVVQNVRLSEELMSLQKREQLITYSSADATEPILGMHRLYLDDGSKILIVNHGDEIERAEDDTSFTSILDLGSADRRWQWLTWHNMAIGTDGYNSPVKYDGTSISATYLGSALATDAGSGSGPTGTAYKYKLSCYSVTYEAIFDQVSNPLTMSGNDIDLSMIPICPDTILGEDALGRKIYRNKTAGSTYYLLSNGTIANNTAVILTDSDADGDLTATTYPAGDLTYKPPMGKYILIHKNRLWISSNPTYPSRAYYSEDASPGIFLASSYFNVRNSDGDKITFMKNVLGKLTIGKNNTIQKIYTDGDVPSSDWEVSDPFSFMGCQAPYSAVSTPMGLFYLANNGIYSFNGQYSQLMSDAATPEIKDILSTNFANVWSAYMDNKYFMAYASTSTGSATNNRVLIVDLLSEAFMKDHLSVNVFEVLDSGTDVEVLYSGSSESGAVYAHSETVNEVVHRTHADFTGTWADMRYIPTGIPGGVFSSPVLELSRITIIDDMVGTIDSATGTIDRRAVASGTYISQYLTIGAATFDKIYWNETIPPTGGDITLTLRAGATTGDCATAEWYGVEYSNSAGSDVSAATADSVVQYRITMTTDDVTATPIITSQDFFNVRLTYNTVGTTPETSIPIAWRSGWLNFGSSTLAKSLKKLYVFYDWNQATAGTLTLTFGNYLGDTDVFEIDLLENPSYYIDYFTNQSFTGNLIRLTVSEDSLNPITIKKIVVVYDVQNQEYKFPN